MKLEIQGPRARAKVQVFEADGKTLVSESPWGEWELISTWFARTWLQQMLSIAQSGSLVPDATVTDSGGVARNVNMRGGGTSFATAASAVVLAWGNGAAALARGDFTVSGQQQTMNASARLDDETAATTTVAGVTISNVTTNITRVGLYYLGQDTSGAQRTVLMDHSTVTSTPVSSGQVVAISYQVAY